MTTLDPNQLPDSNYRNENPEATHGLHGPATPVAQAIGERAIVSDATQPIDVAEIQRALANQPHNAPFTENIVLPPHAGKHPDPTVREQPVIEYRKSLFEADRRNLIQTPDDVSGITHPTSTEGQGGNTATFSLPSPNLNGRPETKPSNRKRNILLGAGAVVVVGALGAMAALGLGKDDNPEKVNPNLQGRVDMTIENGDGSKQIIQEGPNGTFTTSMPAPTTEAAPAPTSQAATTPAAPKTTAVPTTAAPTPANTTPAAPNTVASQVFPLGVVRLQPGEVKLGGPEDHITVQIDDQQVELPKIHQMGDQLADGTPVSDTDIVSAVMANLAALGSLEPGSPAYQQVMKNFTSDSAVEEAVERQFLTAIPNGSGQTLLYDTAKSAGLGGGAFIGTTGQLDPTNHQAVWALSSVGGPLFAQRVDTAGEWQDPHLMDMTSPKTVEVNGLTFTIGMVAQPDGTYRNGVSTFSFTVGG